MGMDRMKRIKSIDRLKNMMSNVDLQGLLLLNPSNIFFATGFMCEGSALIIADEITLIVPEMEEEHANESIDLDIDLDILVFKKKEEYWDKIKERLKDASKIGIEEDFISVKNFEKLKNLLEGRIIEVSEDIQNLRMIKDRREIKNIKNACKLADSGMNYVKEMISHGKRERTVAVELEYWLKKEGAEGFAFDTIVVSGRNASIPHKVSGNRKIRRGEPIIVDFGPIWRGYCADLTRTFFIEESLDVYEICLMAQEEVIKTIKEGIKACEVDKIARSIISEHGYGKNFIHSTGHGIGIDVHEKPRLSGEDDTMLKENMVVTVEPGIYVPKKFGVRIEDVVLVKKNRCVTLTKSEKVPIIF